MSSNLKVNTILPSAGTAIGIGTAGGTVSITGSVGLDNINVSGASTMTGSVLVGVGTTVSTGVLQIRQNVDNSSDYYLNAGNTVHIKNTHANGYASLRLMGGGTGSDNNAIVWGGQGSESLIFSNRQNERIRILADGKVRIAGVSTLTNMGQTLQLLDNDSTDAIGTKSTLGLLGYVNGTARTLAAVGARKNSAGNDFAGDLSFFTRRDNQSLLDERVRITSAGNLNVLAGQVTVATPEFLRVAHTVATHNQSLNDNSTQWVQFGSAYDDTKSGWTSGVNNYYTIQTAGYFLVTAQAVFHSNTASTLRDWALGVEQSQDNGNTYSLIQNSGGRGGGNQYTDTDAIATCVTFILYFNAGTRIRVRAHANTNGGNWQIDEDLGDVHGGNDYGGSNFDNQKGTRLHIIRLF